MTGIGLSLDDDDDSGGQVTPVDPITFGPWTAPTGTTMTIASGRVDVVSADGSNPRASRQIIGLKPSTTYQLSASLFHHGDPETKYVRVSYDAFLTSPDYGEQSTAGELSFVGNITTTADNKPVYIGIVVVVDAAGDGGAISETIGAVEFDG